VLSPSDAVSALRAEFNDKHRLPPVGPKFKTQGWTYRSYYRLLKTLGHSDGMAEVIEVAIRDFIEQASAHGDTRDYLLQRAQHQRIIVHELDAGNIPVRAANFYVVVAYQHLESFIYDFLSEASLALGEDFSARDGKESALDWALRVLPDGIARNKQKIWRERYLLLDYYRRIRNGFVHNRKPEEAIDRAFKTVEKLRPLVLEDYQLAAPNEPHLLTMDDFLLLTRLIKYLATDFRRMCQPNQDQILKHAVSLYQKKHVRLIGAAATKDPDSAIAKLSKFYLGSFRCDLSAHHGLANNILEALQQASR
jgi:hypothetical protein